MTERCMCGADDCPRCYPYTWADLEETDEPYETLRQREIDDNIAPTE